MFLNLRMIMILHLVAKSLHSQTVKYENVDNSFVARLPQLYNFLNIAMNQDTYFCIFYIICEVSLKISTAMSGLPYIVGNTFKSELKLECWTYSGKAWVTKCHFETWGFPMCGVSHSWVMTNLSSWQINEESTVATLATFRLYFWNCGLEHLKTSLLPDLKPSQNT